MKIIRKNEVNKVDNSLTNHVEEYLHGDKDLNLAIADCSERYPIEGFVVNKKCKEIVYILEGQISLIQPGGSALLNKGDSVIIDIGEPFAWEGPAKILTVCTPAWFPDQHVAYSLP